MPDAPSASTTREGDPLTARELELLALVAGGPSTAEIAKQLGIMPSTVQVHLTNIFRKTGTASRAQAARLYLNGLRGDPAVDPEVGTGSGIGRGDEDPTSVPERRRAPRDPARLTGRELQVLELVGAGESTEAIAHALGVSQGTIKTHLTSIYKKTGSQNRIQAIRYYLRRYATVDLSQLATVEDDIADIKARLHELQPAVEEAQHLQDALEALEAARRAFTR